MKIYDNMYGGNVYFACHFYPEDGGTNSSDILVTAYQTTRRHNPEEHSLNLHRSELFFKF
jgi:hypothetical protein